MHTEHTQSNVADFGYQMFTHHPCLRCMTFSDAPKNRRNVDIVLPASHLQSLEHSIV
jgi:hypothetical protein